MRSAKQLEATRFKPGVSGNRSGRPKQLNWLVARGKEITPKLLAVLEHIAFHDASTSNRIKAIQVILDRTYGRPKISVEVDASVVQQFVLRAPLVVATDEDWEKEWGGGAIDVTPTGELPKPDGEV